MSGTEASEDNESSGGLKKQNFTGEADLTDVVMHDSDDLGTRRLWAECVATLTSPHDLRTDEGDIVIGRPIPCHIRAKIGDISDASYASGQLAFNRAVRSPDGEEVASNSFGMMLNLSKPEFRRFWDYHFARWKPAVSVEMTCTGHIERTHPVFSEFVWKTREDAVESGAILKFLSVSLDYQWGEKSSESR